MSKNTQAMKDWLDTRPPAIQVLAEQFPPGSLVLMYGNVFYIVGYTENNSGNDLIISTLNPFDDYEKAVETRQYVCADCVKRMTLH